MQTIQLTSRAIDNPGNFPSILYEWMDGVNGTLAAWPSIDSISRLGHELLLIQPSRAAAISVRCTVHEVGHRDDS